jgi:DNA-binding NarL/FixJ family response regulator
MEWAEAGQIAKVLIDDENPVLRIGFEALLNSVPEIEIIPSGRLSRLECVHRYAPDVIVLGAPVPPVEGILELTRIRPASHVVIVTSADDPRLLVGAIEAGAHSCVVYGHFEPHDLVRIILDAARGESYLSPPAMTALVRRLHGAGAAESRRPGLTRREAEIMELIVAGLTNRAIADRLFISEKTVKNHVHNIYKRLKAGGRDHAVARWRDLTRPGGDHPPGT